MGECNVFNGDGRHVRRTSAIFSAKKMGAKKKSIRNSNRAHGRFHKTRIRTHNIHIE